MAIHINDKGETGKCSAKKGGCPFGSSEEHFSTEKEARQAYEQQMEAVQNYEQLKNLADELIQNTLKVRELADARKTINAKHTAWNELKKSYSTAKAAHEKTLAKVSKMGFNARDLILGVNDEGRIFNLKQIHRIRPYNDEVYSRMAGYKPTVKSTIPVPGDAWIDKREASWKKHLIEINAVHPEGSAENKAERKRLMKKIVKDIPNKRAMEELSLPGLNEREAVKLAYSAPGVYEAIEMRKSAHLDENSADEIRVFNARTIDRAQKMINSL